MRRIVMLGVALIAATAAAIAVASPAGSGISPPPPSFVDDWFTASATAIAQNGYTTRQVVLHNADAIHGLTHTSTVNVYLLSPGVTTPRPYLTTTVTLAFVNNPLTPQDETTWTFTLNTRTIQQAVGIKIVASHVKQLNDPAGGMQPTQSAIAWYPHAP